MALTTASGSGAPLNVTLLTAFLGPVVEKVTAVLPLLITLNVIAATLSVPLGGIEAKLTPAA